MAEPTLLNEGGIQVTRSRLVLPDHSYPLREITAVHISPAPLPRSTTLLPALLGTATLVGGQAAGSLAMWFVGMVLLALAGLWWWRARRSYRLVLSTRAGDTVVLVSANQELVSRVVDAIDSVLVARGHGGEPPSNRGDQ